MRLTAPAATVRGFRMYAFRTSDELLAQVGLGPGILVALNAEKLARGDPRVRDIVARGVGYPDGFGAVLALRRRSLRSARIPGSDLWLQILRRHAGHAGVYLIGGTPDVAAAAAKQLEASIPGLRLLGARDGYFEPGDVDLILDDVERARPQIVLVAIGSPRQELLMAQLYDRLPALYMGLGGSLDVLVGRTRRAPVLLQRLGLEWAYRFAVDPRRLPRLPAYLRFAWYLVRGDL